MKNENTKHTPGPWELSEGNTSLWAKSPWNARVRIAEIKRHSPMNGIDSDANARLIAASPELLEALEKTVTWLKHLADREETVKEGGPVLETIREAREAIAKATGA